MAAGHEGKDSRPIAGPMPPNVQLFDILSEEERSAFLAWAIAHQSSFKPAKVYFHPGEDGSRLDPGSRTALKLREFGPLEPMLRERMFGRLPEILQHIPMLGPAPDKLELELNAYGDGGHFSPHIDVLTGSELNPSTGPASAIRLISAVYYFYSEPKVFSGGALRLFRAGSQGNAGPDGGIAYEPLQNSLVAFPSWARHEVERVHCSSSEFSDFRFALNCWFSRSVAAPAAKP